MTDEEKTGRVKTVTCMGCQWEMDRPKQFQWNWITCPFSKTYAKYDWRYPA